MMVLPRNTSDISTYCHQVISLSTLLQIYHMLTLSAFLQYFAALCSILQYFKWKTMLLFPNNTADISSSLLQAILMASKQQINHLHHICAFLQYFAAFCSILQHQKCKSMIVLPRNTTDISTYCHQVISMSTLLKIYHMLTLSAILQYFAAFCSISQHF